MQAWNEAQIERQKLRHKRFEQCKEFLFWIGGWVGSGRSGVFFFFCGIFSFGALGLIGGINWPTTIVCKSYSGGCHLLRFNKSTVIFPQQTKEIIAEYERNKSKPKRPK
ncbi:hypothetical protein WKK05_37570 (plasmid) [Nostoc sp. UHCC 0302]|uniref:hypothetical protein n=1 Tax=Nostoc sp. UHCC 0302 TaxID=3134896 RepID=UPI00311CAAB9